MGKCLKKKGFILKLDPEKAYDKVSWDFLDEIMRLKGFGNRWRRWIKGCLQNTNFSIMINRKPRGKIVASRGFGQGDPLSSFLFTILGDALSRTIHFCMERRILKGFQIWRNMEEIALLQYADDTIIFCPDEGDLLQNWWDVLHMFMEGSGLSLNKRKTSLIGLNVEQ
ncbi:MAG: reverse transcriptase domain-containing protein [Sweet potato little leaf phytoplasma]|nr:reverse transcriptase domain-containing protein [Sweet potato little leaf phytoplasma]